MIREIMIAIASAVLLYVSYLWSADWIYGTMQTEITALALEYAVSNPTLSTQITETYDIIKIGYKMGILLLWIAITSMLIIVTQRREPQGVYYRGDY